MTEKRKPKRADIYSRGQERIKALEEAGRTSGRTQKEADQEQKIDNVFNDIAEDNGEQKSPTYNWWENIFTGD